MTHASSAASPRYSERLGCPASWWAIALLVGLSFVTAVGFYLGAWFGVASLAAVVFGVVAVLGRLGSVQVVVDSRGLTVGSSLLEWDYQGVVLGLDAPATRARLGVGADARAFVVGRPYLAQAVEVEVRDAADPHPYWLISTRHPSRLAAALDQGRADADAARAL